jgi:hypothetical protein
VQGKGLMETFWLSVDGQLDEGLQLEDNGSGQMHFSTWGM